MLNFLLNPKLGRGLYVAYVIVCFILTFMYHQPEDLSKSFLFYLQVLVAVFYAILPVSLFFLYNSFSVGFLNKKPLFLTYSIPSWALLFFGSCMYATFMLAVFDYLLYSPEFESPGFLTLYGPLSYFYLACLFFYAVLRPILRFITGNKEGYIFASKSS